MFIEFVATIIKEKDFDTHTTFRAIKEKISKEIAHMDTKLNRACLKGKKYVYKIDCLCIAGFLIAWLREEQT